MCSVAQTCPTLCDPMGCSLLGSCVHGDTPGKNTGVGCHSLLQRLFPTQESNQGILHSNQILYHLSYQGRPKLLFFIFKYKVLASLNMKGIILKLNNVCVFTFYILPHK